MERTIADDVRLVGDTLGEVLRAHGGETLFEHVESMRLSAKRAREENSEEAREALSARARSLDAQTAAEVARAFALYFQLVNLAEDVQRTRELTRREREGGPSSVSESLAAILTELRERGASRDEVLAALSEVELRYVFTAHPTEARRRTTERLLAKARDSLEARDRFGATEREQHDEDRVLRAAVEALWEHAMERGEKPEVLDEVKAGLYYLDRVLLDVVPRAQRRLHAAFEDAFGVVDPDALPLPWRFGSWMGADRDGNPFVNEAITERTLSLLRDAILTRYERDLVRLADPLAATEERLPDTAALDHALERAAVVVPEAAALAERQNPREPLRRMITLARERLARAKRFQAGGYPSPDAFLTDLEVMRETLLAAHASALPNDALLELIWRVRCFGFSLAALDVREDSAVHHAVLAELTGDPDYESRDEDTRRAALEKLTLPARRAHVSDAARRLLDLFESLRHQQARFGADAIGTYIISMTHSATDVLEVLRLAELHGIERDLDIVPLLETPEDLTNAGPLLSALLTDPRYREHVRGRGDVQELLVGYSDSMKSGGVLSSRVRVVAAQREAAEVCRQHGVTLRVFHGRGGSVSRGGGPTYRAIRALPRDAFSGCIKITEQGEMRAHNFADPALAARYIEQTGGAALLARMEARGTPTLEAPEDRALLARMADISQRAYRELIGDPDLVRYFREATPLSAIASLPIASRPSKRRGQPGLSDLRAIPWVFAWSQSRHGLTGWYGVGAALDAVASEEGGLARLRVLRDRSPFFCDLLENVEMSLAKADLAIARRYAGLMDDAGGARIFARICERHDNTSERVREVLDERALLDDDPVLQRSIRLRNPYVDPLSYLQVEALRRAREGGDDAARWEHVAHVTVQGIAAGLRHTG